jgi:hypothetical protein
LLLAPGFSLPPPEFCRGGDPSEAEKSRPDLKTFGSGALAAIAAAIFATPGMLASHRLTGFCAWVAIA